MACMRTSLLPGLVTTAVHNINRQQKHLRLFESGLRFVPGNEALPVQQTRLAGLITGTRAPESWHNNNREVDFFDIKGDVERLLSHLAGQLEFAAAKDNYLHPGQRALVRCNGVELGICGTLHPLVAKAARLGQTACVFELDLAAISTRTLPLFSEISRFPEVRRDIAIVVDEPISARQIEQVVRASAGQHFKHFNIFDIYQGKGIELQQKSLAIGLTFQSKSSTLTDDLINNTMTTVIQALAQELNAVTEELIWQH